jgi:hypothetical protein
MRKKKRSFETDPRVSRWVDSLLKPCPDMPGVTMLDMAISFGQLERHVEGLEKEGRFARSLTLSAIRKLRGELKLLEKRIVEEGDQLKKERRSIREIQQRTGTAPPDITP